MTITPGTEVSEIIANALETAQNFAARTGEAAEEILKEAAASRFFSGSYYKKDPVITAEEPAVPEVEDSTFTYEAQLDKLVKLLSGELADFFATYYPLDADAFDDATNWLVNSITNGGTGIKPEIEAQIYERAKERLLAEGKRLEAGITSGHAARGFQLPPGAMYAQLQEARFEQLSKAGELASTIAAKQAEMEVANIRFAVEQAISMRWAAMNAAADYIRALMTSPDAAARMAGLNSDAKAKMIAATSDLYRSRLSRDQLVIGAQTARMQVDEPYTRWFFDRPLKEMEVDVQALSAAAEAFSRTAAAALSSLSAIASTSTSKFE